MRYLELLKDAIDGIQITMNGFAQKPLSYEKGFREIYKIFLNQKMASKYVFICGNGGSAGVAQHMTADFLKNGGLRTQCLYNQPTLTCISNDFEYSSVFSKQLEILAQKGDMLIAISSSGESTNIINAIEVMHQLGNGIVTLTGFNPDNKIRSLGDYNIYVPVCHYGIVESVHNIVLQQMVDALGENT